MSEPIHVHPEYRELVDEIGLTDVAGDGRIRVWRTLPDRENATLDHVRPNGATVRLHVKRYPPGNDTAASEVTGHALLEMAGIATAPLVAHGRSFVIFADLAGYTPGDKLVAGGSRFEDVLRSTADLAADLHSAGLHHRDLYLCHFMVRPAPFDVRLIDVRLIDVARVARLSNPLTRRRWVVKDLAQFWYSTTKLDVTDDQRARWLDRYAERRGIAPARWIGAVRRKSAAIGRHDAKLNERQPNRNISLAGTAHVGSRHE